MDWIFHAGYGPEIWNEENIAKVEANGWGPVNIKGVEEYLSEKEAKGGEDKSFREPYWNFDKRIHDWINKVFESKIPCQ